MNEIEVKNAEAMRSFVLNICEAYKLGRIVGVNHSNSESVNNPYPNSLDNPLGIAWQQGFDEGMIERETEIFVKIFS